MATPISSQLVPASAPRTSVLRRMLAGAAAFDATGGIFCLVASSDVARWLSIPHDAVYVTGAIFLAAAAVGTLTLRREPVDVTWIVGANEVFALWCVLVLAVDSPNARGASLLGAAALSSAGTGAGLLLLARPRLP